MTRLNRWYFVVSILFIGGILHENEAQMAIGEFKPAFDFGS